MTATIAFTSDGYRLAGTLHLPKATPCPVVIGCHGMMADRNSPKQVGLAQACSRQGIGYFRFDHRGCGESQGEFNQAASLEARRRDLANALAIVRSLDACNGTLGLFGSSMGGAVCLSVHEIADVSALITFAAPLHSRLPHAAERHLDVSFDIIETVQGVKSIHIFHGEQDEIVPLDHARMLYAVAAQPKKLTIQAGGDHRMSDRGHQDAFIRQCVAWYAENLLC